MRRRLGLYPTLVYGYRNKVRVGFLRGCDSVQSATRFGTTLEPRTEIRFSISGRTRTIQNDDRRQQYFSGCSATTWTLIIKRYARETDTDYENVGLAITETVYALASAADAFSRGRCGARPRRVHGRNPDDVPPRHRPQTCCRPGMLPFVRVIIGEAHICVRERD